MASRYTIEDMQELAVHYNGKCLSKEYWNSRTKLKWMCEKRHTWDALPTIVKQGGWCRQCVTHSRQKLNLEEMQQIAIKRGGKCLSKEYINTKVHLKWECKEGHKWLAKPGHVKNVGSWCPHCTNKAKLTIEQMQELAKEKNGKCISKKYVNSHTKLIWECDKNHRWKADPSKIKTGRWCPHYDCRYAKVSKKLRANIEELQLIAKERGGKLISTADDYINRYTPLVWECEYKHRWKANASNIKFGFTWCAVCLPSKKQKSEYKKEKKRRMANK